VINGQITPFDKNPPVILDKVKSAGFTTQVDIDA